MSGENKWLSLYPSETAQKKISEMVQRMLFIDLVALHRDPKCVLDALAHFDWYDELVEMYADLVDDADEATNDIPPSEEGMNSQFPRT